jgi:hypothetical protein
VQLNFGLIHLYTRSEKNYDREHLKEYCWYLECPKGWVHSDEVAIRKKISGEPEELSDDDEEEVEPVLVVGKSKGRRKKKAATSGAAPPSPPDEAPDASSKKKRGKLVKKPAETSGGSQQKKISPREASEAVIGSTLMEDFPVLDIVSLTEPSQPLFSQCQKTKSRSSACIVSCSVDKMTKQLKEMSRFAATCKPNRTTNRGGVPTTFGLADLVICDVIDDLPVPLVSDPADAVPA